jgi:hypothetical protein
VRTGIDRVASWLTSPARALHIYLVAAAIGLGAFLAVYGPAHLVGASTYWQMPGIDERMALMGYRYFLHDTWHWPVFVNDAVNVPYPKSVAFLDCIPLWALINKAIATVVPPWRAFSADAYLGLWHGLAYVLQACFGVACLRALGHRSWRAGLVAAVFLIATPAWIFRYGHPALSAHWIELWALALYLRTPPSRWYGVAQLAVACLVSPYHAALSLPLFLASLLRSRAVIWLPVGLAGMALATWFAGYFASEAAGPQWGFRWESANLLGWLIPPRSGILGDAQWIANVNPNPWQYEGYAYLGLGALGLLVAYLVGAKPRAVIARHPFLFAIAVAAGLFALSNHIYFGSHEIATYPIPRLLRWVTYQFRSPGRFVWIPMYVVMIYLLHAALTRAVRWRGFALVALATVVQVVDAGGEWSWQRASTAGPHGPMLDLATWRPLVHSHRAVVILPPYPCVESRVDDAPTFDHASTEIQLLASERALPINGTYCARELRKCDAEERAWSTLEPEPGALYVVLPPAAAVATRFAARGLRCGSFAYGQACSTEAAAIDRAALKPLPAPISLGYGQRLAVGDAALGADWTAAERGGRWTTSSVAALLLHLDGEPPPAVALKLELQARLCGTRTAQDVDVLLDEQLLATLHFDASANDAAVVRTVAIADRDRLRRAAFTVQLRPHDVRPLAKLGCDADPRRLGVWLSGLWLE